MKLFNDKEFNKKLFALVLPIAFQQFMLNLVNATDAVMLGMIGQSELASVSLAGQIQYILTLFLAAINNGASVSVAQYWGKRDLHSIEKIFAATLRVTVPVSFLFTLCSAIFPDSVMVIFTSDPEMIAGGAEYLRWVSLSYLLCGISQTYLCIMKNCKHAVQSAVITSVSAALNVVLNAVLILGLFGFPKMGIAGAALATAISRLVEMVWVVVSMRLVCGVRLKARNLRRRGELLHKYLWKYTLPILGSYMVWGVGLSMTSVIMGHLGSDATAANSIASIAKNLGVCVSIGISNGGGIIVGNALGAGKLEKAREYGGRLVRVCLFFGAIAGLVLLSVSPLIVRSTSLSPQSTQYLKWMLVVCAFYMIGKYLNGTVIAGIFNAGGDSKFGFRCDAISMWGVIVPMGFIAAFVLDLPVIVVYILLNLDEYIKIPAVYVNYKKYRWVKDLTIKNEEVLQEA